MLVAAGSVSVLVGCSAVVGGGGSDGAGGRQTPTSNASSASAAAVTGDEFSGPAGSLPDSSIWTAETGAGGWGNHELQTYTADNAVLDGSGHLVISAVIGGTAANPTYTSARLTTAGKHSFTTGTLSARIKLPEGPGLLPAFWLLGSDVDQVGWPAAGEIDVVEAPHGTSTSSHNIHGPNSSDMSEDVSVSADVEHDTPLSRGYHVYSVTRTADSVTIRVDGKVANRLTRDTAPGDLAWVLDKPMDVLFSLAIGGDWPGAPTAATPATSTMTVDWVRLTE